MENSNLFDEKNSEERDFFDEYWQNAETALQVPAPLSSDESYEDFESDDEIHPASQLFCNNMEDYILNLLEEKQDSEEDEEYSDEEINISACRNSFFKFKVSDKSPNEEEPEKKSATQRPFTT